MVDADVVIDLVNSRSFEPSAVREFFTAHEKNLLVAEAGAGVRHHVVLSIVGTDRAPANGYFRSKVAHEELIKSSGVPYTSSARHSSWNSSEPLPTGQKDAAIYIPTGSFQPIAANDVAAIVSEVALSAPS